MTGRRLVVFVLALALTGIAPQMAGAAPGPSYTTLQPGQPANLREQRPVQVVFVGYDEAEVDPSYFREYLPPTIRPVDRVRSYAPDPPAYLGLQYSFDYALHYTDSSYEDAFFGYLRGIGVEEDRISGQDISLFQSFYNRQPGRSLDITDNLVISGPKVERWLVEHPAPGVDPERDTIVFVNWWGRPDFRFHEYEVIGDPQSETGVDFGATFWTRRLTAWGGTSATDEETGFGRASRTWFHDLSAGPEWRTSNWVIDDTLGGLGADPSKVTFFPPTWEYAAGNPAIADRWPIPDALGVIARFVAMNMLMAASPLYGNDADANVPTDVELDVTVQNALSRPVFTPQLLLTELSELLGAAPKLDVEYQPFAGLPKKCAFDFAAWQRCRPELDPAVYEVEDNLYLGAQQTQAQWRDGSAEFEAPAFVQGSEADHAYLGVAADNSTDHTRAAAFSSPRTRTMNSGYGPTSTLIHEYGHFFGLSHTHDGWEGEWWQQNYAAQAQPMLFFTWLGNEVSSAMSYMFLTNDFSQFDLDNYGRWQTARFLKGANTIAADVLASRRAGAGAAELAKADQLFTQAQVALQNHDYDAAEANARAGYLAVRRAAANTGTAVPKSDIAWTTTQPGKWNNQRGADGVNPAADPIGLVTAGTQERLHQ